MFETLKQIKYRPEDRHVFMQKQRKTRMKFLKLHEKTYGRIKHSKL